MFRNLRTLGVSHAEFHTDKPEGTTATKVVPRPRRLLLHRGGLPRLAQDSDEGPAKVT